MAVYNISSINGTSVDTVYSAIVVLAPWIVPLVLFFEFMLIMLTGIYQQNRRVGFSNVPMWGSIAGLVTTTSAVLLTGVTKYVNGTPLNLVDGSVIGLLLAITIGFTLWFFLSDLD
jgi:hypothetical protein